MLPIRTSVRPAKTPYANYALIGVNTIIFFMSYWPHTQPYSQTVEALRPWAEKFMLAPVHPHLWQFVTYAFLHGSFLHIFGNMFFLYIFGNNVNDKLGHFGYLCFYLAGGVFSAVGHILVSSAPVIGASGAISAVTGAYLVLFPQTLITIVYWFYIIGTMEIPAIYFIALKMIILDNVIARYTTNVAYDAHLAGYTFGIVASLILLATGLTATSHFDLWAMVKQWNRRRQYRDTISTGYDPYTGFGGTKRIESREIKKADVQRQEDPRVRQIRGEISDHIYKHDFHAAAELYFQLVGLDDEQVIPRQHLLDIANQLTSEGQHDRAAQVYEKFLTHYGNYEYVEQVELMLGLIYSRYLDKPELAIKYLTSAEIKLTDPGQLKMCRDEIDKLQKR
ncbi:MAG: rhomboid family intramembrane serine protease [Sedimentisphaerales bacterium]|jgi:membrane associated rhomboid family serine protease